MYTIYYQFGKHLFLFSPSISVKIGTSQQKWKVIFIVLRKIVCFVLVFVFAFSLSALPLYAIQAEYLTAYGATSVTVYVNDQCLYRSADILLDDTTYVEISAFRSLIGDDETDIHAEGNMLKANGRSIYLPNGVIEQNGSQYVPVRAIARLYLADVSWDGNTQTVRITTDCTTVPEADAVYNANDLYWLSHIIYAESGAESLEGQLAVGTVIMNRVVSDDFPDSIYDVVFDTKFGVQFTPIANGTVYNDPSELSIDAAKMTLEGYRISESILYFIYEEIATSRWMINNCTYVMTIGCHDFYA